MQWGLAIRNAGPLTNLDDAEAMRAYGEQHDVLANVGLEEPAALETGSLGWASGGVRARGLGSLKLSGTDEDRERLRARLPMRSCHREIGLRGHLL